MKQYKLTQRVLKIGHSAGVTLPAKQLKAMGVQYSLNKIITALSLRLAS